MLRRSAIADLYHPLVDAMYQGRAEMRIETHGDGQAGTAEADIKIRDAIGHFACGKRGGLFERRSPATVRGALFHWRANPRTGVDLLRFGGVHALTNVSFNVLEHEVRAIIGPNGAGKSSMLNVINGVYVPQEGSITFRGERLSGMTPTRAAHLGIARTFQNIALYRGMSVLDNIMAGRNLRMHATFLDALNCPRVARKPSTARRPKRSSSFSRSSIFARRQWRGFLTACKSVSNWAERLRPSPLSCCSMSRWPA